MKKCLSMLVVVMLLSVMWVGGALAERDLTGDYATVEGQAYLDVTKLSDMKTNEPYTIGLAMTNVATGWFKALYDDLDKMLTEAGCKVLIVECGDDATKQVSQLNNFIVQGVDAIIINPANPQEAVSMALNQVYEAGIPVVAVDVPPADDAQYLSACVTDAYQLGYLVGEELATRLIEMYPEGEIPYGLIGGTDGNSIAASRNQGARDAIAAVDSDGRIVEKTFLYAGAYSEESGLTTAQNMLSANPDLKCIIGTCDAHIVGATRAAEALGLEKGLIMGAVDGSKAAMQIMLENGPIVVLGLNSPSQVGIAAGKTILTYLSEGTLPAAQTLTLQPAKITSANIADYYNPDSAW
ncbi:MAG: sugar ABC transporter substrate-binding protein [Clostridia bacterium]